jgi:hypothetical protein
MDASVMRAFLGTAVILSVAPFSVVLAEEYDLSLGYHEPRTAFYERSPNRIGALMRNAVSSACRDPSGKAGSQQRPEWLCDGSPLSYLRAVYVTGRKSSDGFVCRGDEMSSLRYYTPDMLNFEEPDGVPMCLPVVCEGEPGKYHVVLSVDQPTVPPDT